MGAVAATGAVQLADAALTVLNRIALVTGYLSLLAMVLVIIRLACAASGDRHLARLRKQNRTAAPELGDDVLDTIALWHRAEFDEGLERLLTEEERRNG